MTLANQLTMLRIALALALFGALMRQSYACALALYAAATLTDWVDGAVARMTGTISAFGKVADPIADKILVLGALIALTRTGLDVPAWAVFLIIARELLIGGMRTLAGAQGKSVAAESWGKWKMAVQSVSIAAMLVLLVLRERAVRLPVWTIRLPYGLTVLCAAVAWTSAIFYFRQSRRLLEKSWG